MTGTGLCRTGDFGIGTCPLHGPEPVTYTTVFSNGAPTGIVNGQPACTMVTIGIASCGHPTVVISGSPKTNIEKTSAHRVGDDGTNSGGYIAVEGADNVTSV